MPSSYELNKDEEDTSVQDSREPDMICLEDALDSVPLEKRGGTRSRKKKLPFDEICVRVVIVNC